MHRHAGPFNRRKWSAYVFHHCSWLRESQAACLSDERHVSDASLGPSLSRVPHMETQVGGSSENMRRCRTAIVVPLPPPPHHKVNTRTAPFTQGRRAQRPRPPPAQRPRAEQDIPSILGFKWNEKRYVSLPVCLGDTARPFVPPQELRDFFLFSSGT